VSICAAAQVKNKAKTKESKFFNYNNKLEDKITSI
jgi:hypothetical protein